MNPQHASEQVFARNGAGICAGLERPAASQPCMLMGTPQRAAEAAS